MVVLAFFKRNVSSGNWIHEQGAAGITGQDMISLIAALI